MSIRTLLSTSILLIIFAFSASSLTEREVANSSKITELTRHGHPHTRPHLQKPMAPVNVRIDNRDGSDPQTHFQQLEIQVFSIENVPSLEFEVARANDIEIVSSNLPNVEFDILANEVIHYSMDVEITGPNPHLVIRASSLENGVRTGNIGNFQFLDAQIDDSDGLDSQNKLRSGRSPASVGPDRSRLRLDPSSMKITR